MKEALEDHMGELLPTLTEICDALTRNQRERHVLRTLMKLVMRVKHWDEEMSGANGQPVGRNERRS